MDGALYSALDIVVLSRDDSSDTPPRHRWWAVDIPSSNHDGFLSAGEGKRLGSWAFRVGSTVCVQYFFKDDWEVIFLEGCTYHTAVAVHAVVVRPLTSHP